MVAVWLGWGGHRQSKCESVHIAPGAGRQRAHHVGVQRRSGMSQEDYVGDAIERLEWDERKEEDSPLKNFKQLTRRTALTGGAAGIAAMVLEACGSSSKTPS